MEVDDYTVYMTIIGSRGMQGNPWNGSSAQVYMKVPRGYSDQQIKDYITNSIILEWEKEQ